MTKEACPKCKSEKTELVQVDGEEWWICRFQGCDGRISGDWYHFRPGQGLEPKQPKKPAPPKPEPPPAETADAQK